jgi:uncharacterized protein YbjT (DUF2867 family)
VTLITGITGKSGKWFLRKLIKEKKENEGCQYRFFLRKNSDTALLDSSGLDAYTFIGDLNDLEAVDKAMDGISTVFHIAGIQTSLNIVQSAIKAGVKRAILVHTTGIFSKYKYASSEYLDIESKIETMLKGERLELTILRPTMIYGSTADRNMIVFIRMVDKLRLFPVVDHAKYPLQPVYEKDLGEAYYHVLKKPIITKGKNYILSGKDPILLMDVFKTISRCLGKKTVFLSIPFPIAYFFAWSLFIGSFGKIDFREKVQRLIEPRAFSHDEAQADFGYSPMPFEDGIELEIREYLSRKKG